MRKALVVGIDFYSHAPVLFGCVNDANSVKGVLERHYDGSVNFSVKLLCGGTSATAVKRSELREQIKELFSGDSDIALFYFAGHGHIEETGGYLIASDSGSGDEGIPLADVLVYANGSRTKNRLIVLDSCYSGIAGSTSASSVTSELKEGTTILTASTADQYASELNNSGVFTTLFVDALSGEASNLVGDVTPGSVYAHIDQSLGPWEQRPVFKTNVKSFVSIRKVKPPITLVDLQRLIQFFPSAGHEYRVDPSYEPRPEGKTAEMPAVDPVNTERFACLQRLNRVGLVVPVGAPHMWDAALGYKTLKLTVLGEHYRKLVERKRI